MHDTLSVGSPDGAELGVFCRVMLQARKVGATESRIRRAVLTVMLAGRIMEKLSTDWL